MSLLRCRQASRQAPPGTPRSRRRRTFVVSVCKFRVTRAIVHRGNTKFAEAGDVGPPVLCAGPHRRHGRHGIDKCLRQWSVETWPALPQRHRSTRFGRFPRLPIRAQRTRTDAAPCPRTSWREPVVDGHHTFVWHHVSSDSSANRHRVQAFPVREAVNGDGRGLYVASALSSSKDSCIALTPFHARALCAATPGNVTSARRVPLHPPSMPADVGSPSIAKSPSSHSG